LSDGGTDWKLWRVRDVETGQDLPDLVTFTKFTEVSWAADDSGFYYSRYPAANGNHGNDKAGVVIYHHRLRDEQSLDTLVYAVKDHPTRNPMPWSPGMGVSDHRSVRQVCGERDRSCRCAAWRSCVGKPYACWTIGARIHFIGSRAVFFFLTTQGAPRGCDWSRSYSQPERGAWRQIAPEMAESIETASFVSGRRSHTCGM
jgi:prolyl oligopeptidase